MTGAAIGTVVQLAGSAIEVWGGVLMANALLQLVPPLKTPKYLVNALFGGKAARGVARLRGATEENRLTSLRGLALVTLGFLLQFFGTLVGWFYQP